MRRALAVVAALGFFALEIGAIIAYIPPAMEHWKMCGVTGNDGACLTAFIYGGAFVLCQAGVFAGLLISNR